MRFVIVLTPDLEDGGYTVTAVGLPGLVTDGDTVEEAMANAREAIHLYFASETPESLAASGVRLDAQIATVDVDLSVAIAEPALAIAD
ncbi:MAG TPA: type II toxin-antitoxin system HicB family antitoxin [Thermomicrobiales bacterium]|jgi:predicted RNase H-like HicB family nuclease